MPKPDVMKIQALVEEAYAAVVHKIRLEATKAVRDKDEKEKKEKELKIAVETEAPSRMLEALVAGVVKQQLEHHNLITEPMDFAEPVDAESATSEGYGEEKLAAGRIIQYVTKNEKSPGAARGKSKKHPKGGPAKTDASGGKGKGKGSGGWHPNTSGLREYAKAKSEWWKDPTARDPRLNNPFWSLTKQQNKRLSVEKGTKGEQKGSSLSKGGKGKSNKTFGKGAKGGRPAGRQ